MNYRRPNQAPLPPAAARSAAAPAGSKRRWVLAAPPGEGVEVLADELGISPVTAGLLWNRNLRTAATATDFLRPRLNQLHEPWSLPDIDIAARRLGEAVRGGESIVIYGDYDVDGIAATAMLLLCLRMLGANVSHYLPDRQEEGYGLNLGAVEALAERGVRLIVTVDCGVSARREVDTARERGMDIIITDHHEPGPDLPAALAVVNPKRADSTYPFRDLCGAGVAFKLAWALGKTLAGGRQLTQEFRDFLLDSMALAGLATISDVVPLLGENRVLTRFGLDGLSHSKRVGLAALRRAARVEGEELDTFDVAFKLAPRLNAAGRLGAADIAVELLTTTDSQRAEAIAALLEGENTRRRAVQLEITNEARPFAEAAVTADERAIVIAGDDWHPGVIGIVASRLVAEFGRPVVMLSRVGDEVHGSCRSIEGFHMYEALHACNEFLTTYGGHAKAAGMRLPASSADAFEAMFRQVAAERLTDDTLAPKLNVDAEIALADVSLPLLRETALMAPFGEQNPEPLFVSRGLEIVGTTKRMGQGGQHLSFWVRQGDCVFRAIAFGQGELVDELEHAGRCSLVYHVSENHWQGRDSIELVVEDIELA